MLTGILLAFLAAPSARPESLEIRAALSGFNLLDASTRCCAFTLALAADGSLTTSLQTKDGERRTSRRVPPEELDRLRRVIRDAKFLSLPADVPSMAPVDADEHRMHIRFGPRARKVTLHEWPANWGNAGHLSKRDLDRIQRAFAVWRAIRDLITDPEATVP
jgi:hypothetical protein